MLHVIESTNLLILVTIYAYGHIYMSNSFAPLRAPGPANTTGPVRSLNRIARSERIKRIMIGCVSCAASVRKWQGVSIQMASVKHYDTVRYVYDGGV